MSNNKIIVDLWKKWKQAKITIVVIVMCFIITLNSRIHKSNDLVNRMMQTSFDILIISLTILYLYAVPKEIWGGGSYKMPGISFFFCHIASDHVYTFGGFPYLTPIIFPRNVFQLLMWVFINIYIPKPGIKGFGSK